MTDAPNSCADSPLNWGTWHYSLNAHKDWSPEPPSVGPLEGPWLDAPFQLGSLLPGASGPVTSLCQLKILLQVCLPHPQPFSQPHSYSPVNPTPSLCPISHMAHGSLQPTYLFQTFSQTSSIECEFLRAWAQAVQPLGVVNSHGCFHSTSSRLFHYACSTHLSTEIPIER